MTSRLDLLFGPDPDLLVCARCGHPARSHRIGCVAHAEDGKVCPCVKFQEGPRGEAL